MRTCTRETLSRVMLLAAAWLLLLVVLPAARLDAQPVPPAATDDQGDDPPRHDLRMGNTENMRLGRDAQGNIIMEIHAPPPNMQAQPPVGPFFIYPQVGVPMGGQGGMTGQTTGGTQGTSGATTWGRTGTSGRTSTWGASGQTMQPGQTVRPSGQ